MAEEQPKRAQIKVLKTNENEFAALWLSDKIITAIGDEKALDIAKENIKK